MFSFNKNLNINNITIKIAIRFNNFIVHIYLPVDFLCSCKFSRGTDLDFFANILRYSLPSLLFNRISASSLSYM